MKRMTDERLAEIEMFMKADKTPAISFTCQLLLALKAEREIVDAVELLPEKWREASAKGQTNECYAIAQCADELDKVIEQGE